MAITFTPEQEQVIQLHDRNILVSAAAGSGKTAVLSERIVRMVCDGEQPVDIDRLLVVTFTNAAAAEMRERIAQGIAAKLREQPKSEHIQRQAALLHNAQITTIDSFCLFLIRNHFQEIGLDPAFRVADENELKLLEQDVLAELLEESYGEGSEAFLHCVEFFCPAGGERALEEDILSLSRHAASCPFPEEWLLARKRDYSVTMEELLQGEVGSYLKRYTDAMLDGCLRKLQEAQRLCEEPDGPYMYGELVEKEAQALAQIRACDSLEEYGARIPAFCFDRLPSRKDDSVSPGKRELAKSLRTQVKGTLNGLGEQFFKTPFPLAASQSKACEAAVGTLVDLVLEFDRRVRSCKQEKKMIDFSDMEHYALQILLERDGETVKPSRVALEYRQYFAEILIDEYQDSNLVQEYLLKAISGEEDGHFNRFMVGDVKQSIYRFRLARPELFLEKYASYQENDLKRCRIDLSRNFRSREQVVNTVNSVFEKLMNPDTGGISYDDRAALHVGAEYPEAAGCESEFLLVEKPESAGELNAKQAEALAIAGKIKELKRNFKVYDRGQGKLRPLRYSDIVILLRTNAGWDEEFKAVLEREGIPAYITSRTGYFAATEVQELLQVLRVLDNPRQDVPLYGMMRSIFGGFEEEEIAILRAAGRDISLYGSLCLWGEGQEEALLEVRADTQEAVETVEKEYEAVEKTQTVGKESEVVEKTQTVGKESELVEKTQTIEKESEVVENRLESVERGKESEEVENKYEAAKKQVEVIENESEAAKGLREKAAEFLGKLREYRSCTVYMPIRELLQKLVEEHDYLNYVTALPAGSRRRANVEMLFAKASDFEKTSYHGLFHFVRYMEQLERYDVDYGEAETLDENADVVRIMSIHKSKGLEFPVTFVSGLSKRFNVQDYSRAMIMDMDMGIGVNYVDPVRRIRNKTLRQNVIARKLREENLAEELRVLYVALTRAKEKLILTATVENAEEKWEAAREQMRERLEFSDFMEASSYLDFLMPVLAGTDLQVKLIGKEELEIEKLEEQFDLAASMEKLQASAERAEASKVRELQERLDFVYPYQNLEKLYTKTSVSELKEAAMAQRDEEAFQMFEEREIVPYIPEFRREKEKVSGTARGNAFHRTMEILDFDGLLEAQFEEFPTTYDQYQAGLDRDKLYQAMYDFLIKEKRELRLSEEYYEALNQKKIIHFIESPLAYRMWSAQRRGELYREQPFVFGIDAKRLSDEFPDGEKVLIQGIIDVFWVENGELVLLDYKTDVIGSMAELWNRYEEQLLYYQEALEKLMGLPVKEKVLYSFYLETGGENA